MISFSNFLRYALSYPDPDLVAYIDIFNGGFFMFSNCIKFSTSTFTPKSGDPIPMYTLFLDFEGFNDVVKLFISQAKVSGTPRNGKCYIDCSPRYASGGKIVWRPCSVRFPNE